MPTNRDTVLCRYHYDPLDRLATCTPSEQASTQRFYQKTRLATEIQGSVQRSIFQQEDQLLAQQQRQGGTVVTTLLATDQQRSVLNALDAMQPHHLAYTPYGHRPSEGGLLSLLGFNGERPDPVTGHYVLGNGYRAFNPVLMRFNSPDSWSPFGEGGLNAYAYCVGDPVNRNDPTGHNPKLMWTLVSRNLKFLLGKGDQVSTLVKKSVVFPKRRMTNGAIKRPAADAASDEIKIVPIKKVAPTVRTPSLSAPSGNAPLPPNAPIPVANQATERARLLSQLQADHMSLSQTMDNLHPAFRMGIDRDFVRSIMTNTQRAQSLLGQLLERNGLVVPRAPTTRRTPRNFVRRATDR